MVEKEEPSVVLIEDNDAVRKSLVRLLRTQFDPVIEYDSAKAFLDRDDHASVGCLIVDFRLPWMDGSQLIEALSNQGVRVPTILISGLCDDPISETLAKYGHVSFLPKPLQVAELFASVHECLKRQ